MARCFYMPGFLNPWFILSLCAISVLVSVLLLLCFSCRAYTFYQYIRLWKGHSSLVGPWQPLPLPSIHVHTALLLSWFPGSLVPWAQSGLSACGIHNVRHLHFPSNNQINLGPCAGLWLATVAYQSSLDFAQENNKSWRLHLLPWITSTPFPHCPHRERFTTKGRWAHSLWKALAP